MIDPAFICVIDGVTFYEDPDATWYPPTLFAPPKKIAKNARRYGKAKVAIHPSNAEAWRAAGLVPLDEGQAHGPVVTAPVVCPDCKGTRVYVGIGFYAAEACRLCAGTGKVAGALELNKFVGTRRLQYMWPLPAGLRWNRRTDWGWYLEEPATGFSLTSQGGFLDQRDDAADLLELIKKRNAAG